MSLSPKHQWLQRRTQHPAELPIHRTLSMPPSNPFGNALNDSSTPCQHLALRFQLVRCGVGPKQGGAYCTVQVPQSYTFTHLRCLIAFLFGVRSHGGGPEDEHLFEIKKKVALYSARHKPVQIKVGPGWKTRAKHSWK
jgi:hypothetical protein